MGHKLEESEGPHSKPTTKMLRSAYEKAYDHLRIQTRGPTIQAKRIGNLEEKLLLQERVRLQERDRLQKEKAELEERVRQLEKQLGKEQRNKEDLKDRIHRTEEKLVDLTKLVERLIENA